MNILSIETSCDDTSVSVIKTSGKKRVSLKVLSNIISSQIEVHKEWGGVYPSLAKREHKKNLIPVFKKSLKKSGFFKKTKERKINKEKIEEILEKEPELLEIFLKEIPKIAKPKIDIISVTEGPGLEPCLWVGINFAKALSSYWGIPIVPVNHIKGHIYASFLEKKITLKSVFPAICLVVSGGHTQLMHIKNVNNYKIIGETRDDAAGECLDKAARILGLEYPGGPVIEKISEGHKEREKEIVFPRPMIHSNNYDFSFSGLKTAVLYNFKKRSKKEKESKEYIQEACFQTQQAIIDVLIYKTFKAIKEFKVKSLIIGGGVTANKKLKKEIKKIAKRDFPKLKLYMPEKKYCTDNAAMTAAASYFQYLEKGTKNWKKIKANSGLRIK